jgi:hypothetical protein
MNLDTWFGGREPFLLTVDGSHSERHRSRISPLRPADRERERDVDGAESGDPARWR